MKQTERVNGRRVALGAAISLAVYLALLAVLALLLVRGAVGEERIGVCIWSCACLAAFAGAKTAVGRRPDPFASAALCAAAFFALALLFGFLLNDTLEPERAVMLAAAILAGGAAACLGRAGGRRGKRKHRSRK